MLVVLAPEHKEHLQLLTTLDLECATTCFSCSSILVAAEFARMAVEMIYNGINTNVYTSAGSLYSPPKCPTKSKVICFIFNLESFIHFHISEKLQVPADKVQLALEGIMFLMTECSKLNVRPVVALLTTGFRDGFP
jgi:hypothetical protein